MAIQLSHKKNLSAVLIAPLSAEHTDREYRLLASGETENATTYQREANFLQKKYATDEYIAGAESNITCFAYPSSITSSQYVQKRETKTLYCEDVYKEYVLYDIFSKGFDASILHTICEYWGRKCKLA